MSRKVTFSFWLLVSIFTCNFIHAQQYNPLIKHFTIEDGLPGNNINCFLEDSRGFIWIGTLNGLAKYDGNKFTSFFNNNFDILDGQDITSLYEDTDGLIWIGTKIGLFCYQRNKMDLAKVELRENNNKAKDRIYSIKQWNDSIIIVGGFKGLYLYNKSSGLSGFYKYPDNISTDQIRILDNSDNQVITISLNFSVFEFNIKTQTYSEISGLNNNQGLLIFNNSYIVKDWINSNIYRYDKATMSCRFLTKQSFWDVFAFNNNLYIVSSKCMLKYDSNFRMTDSIFFNLNKYGEETIFIKSFYEKDNNILWLGTNQGLYKIVPNYQFHYLSEDNGLNINYIQSLHIDTTNNLYFGTVNQDKLYLISNINKKIRNSLQIKNSISSILYPVPTYATNKIIKLKNEDLLILGIYYVFLYSHKSKKITDYYTSKNTFYWSAIEYDDAIWAGTSTGPALTRLYVEDETVKVDTIFDKVGTSSAAYVFYKDSLNQVWIGGEGLYKMVKKNGQNNYAFEEVLPYYDTITKKNNQIFSNIQEPDKDHLLVGTVENGMFLVDKKDKLYRHFTRNEGLSSNAIRGLIMDNNKNTWISTTNGLNRLDLEKDLISKYTTQDGLITNTFTGKTCGKTEDGWLFFGTKNGIIYFHPDSLKYEKYQSPLYVTELKVFDRIVRTEIRDRDAIELEHDENFFTLEFSYLDFRSPSKTQYEYILLGNDRIARITNGENPRTNYTNVPPGKYIFELKAIDPLTQIVVNKLEIPITIKPAFYQTTWFNALIISVLISIILGVFYFFYKRQVLKGRLYKLELDLLRSQMNPHFIFNIMSAIQSIVMKNEKTKAVDYLAKFARLMRMNLKYTLSEYATIEETIYFLETYIKMASLNLNEPIAFIVEVDSSIDTNKLLISPMLIQPFIENAIVHGLSPKNKEMKLSLSLKKTGDLILCSVVDNGIGIKEANKQNLDKQKDYESVGIKITKRRNLLQLKKYKLNEDNIEITERFDKMGNSSGTEVNLKITYLVKS